jgi:hypothetical protein
MTTPLESLVSSAIKSSQSENETERLLAASVFKSLYAYCERLYEMNSDEKIKKEIKHTLGIIKKFIETI